MSTVTYRRYEWLQTITDFRRRTADHTNIETTITVMEGEQTMRKTFATLLAGAALIGISGTAAARVDVGISFGFPAPVYVAPPPVVYTPPPPVYVAPRPVYVAPAPVYYAPRRYYGPPAVVIRGHRGGHHRHHW
jgi:hypothetical protein